MGIFRIELGGVGMTGGADGSVPLAFKAPETTPGAAAIKLPVAKNFRRLKDCPLIVLAIVRSSRFTVRGVYAIWGGGMGEAANSEASLDGWPSGLYNRRDLQRGRAMLKLSLFSRRSSAGVAAIMALALGAGLVLMSADARAQAELTAVTDQTTYNFGSTVRIRLVGAAPGTGSGKSSEAREILATLRYAGETQPVVQGLPLGSPSSRSGEKRSGEYIQLWKVPLNARTGRYEVDFEERDPKSHRALLKLPGAASFAVHHKLVRIERIDLDKAFYNSGDPVAAVVEVRNLTGHALAGLRVEFSDRYWPWIAQSSKRAGVDVVPLAESLSLVAGGRKELRSGKAAVAASVDKLSVHQYAVVVSGRDRKSVNDIAFSRTVFIHPPGSDGHRPYPPQYLYPSIGDVSVTSYRHFYPLELDSPAIQFDHSHTMFASGGEGEINFSVSNSGLKPWHGVSIRTRLLAPDGSEVSSNLVAQGLDLEARASSLKEAVRLRFPPAPAGIYRAEVRVEDASGEVLAVNYLELGVNPLPRSILVFCAHEDDEGAHAGIIRAAVEDLIPLHFVYFTSGDAGSCDRYYQHSCGPAEALNFGAIRMQETRASLGHLGVSREDIYFLGLPDGGSAEIWYNHIKPSSPYLSVLLASDHAPYEGLARPNIPYARESAVGLAKEFIRKLQPEVIYTGHPDERHVDHRTNNWFVVKALEGLAREGGLPPNVTLLVDQVY